MQYSFLKGGELQIFSTTKTNVYVKDIVDILKSWGLPEIFNLLFTERDGSNPLAEDRCLNCDIDFSYIYIKERKIGFVSVSKEGNFNEFYTAADWLYDKDFFYKMDKVMLARKIASVNEVWHLKWKAKIWQESLLIFLIIYAISKSTLAIINTDIAVSDFNFKGNYDWITWGKFIEKFIEKNKVIKND